MGTSRMRTVIVRRLSPAQQEPWEFRLESLDGGGGIVSVPASQQGYPVDWPPLLASQDQWLHTLAPQREARAGAAWYLEARDWERLVQMLDDQVAREQSGPTPGPR